MTKLFLKRIAGEWDINVHERAAELETKRDSSYFQQIIPKTLELISSIPVKDGKTLDIGCGLGYLTHEIKKAGCDVKGIDISSRSIAYASSKFQDVSFISTDLKAYSASHKNSYRLCLAVMFLHNSFNLDKQFRYINRLLVPNGQAVICIPHPCFWYRRFDFISYKNPRNSSEKLYKVNFKIKNGQPHTSKISYYHRTLETYYQLLKNTGFKVERLIEHDDSRKESDLLFLCIKKV